MRNRREQKRRKFAAAQAAEKILATAFDVSAPFAAAQAAEKAQERAAAASAAFAAAQAACSYFE